MIVWEAFFLCTFAVEYVNEAVGLFNCSGSRKGRIYFTFIVFLKT